MNWQTLLFCFTGRISQRDFWIGFAALFAAGFVASLLPVVGTAASLALLYPSTALMAKRLHDFGRSGWLVLVPAASAALSGTLAVYTTFAMSSAVNMGAALAAAGFALLISTVAVLTGLAFLLWVGVKAGDAGPNAYGDVPNDCSLTA